MTEIKTTTISPEAWKFLKRLQIKMNLNSMVETLDKFITKAVGEKWKEGIDKKLAEDIKESVMKIKKELPKEEPKKIVTEPKKVIEEPKQEEKKETPLEEWMEEGG